MANDQGKTDDCQDGWLCKEEEENPVAGGPGKGQAESFLDKLDIQCVGVQVPYIQHLQSTLDERFLQVVPGTEVKLPPGPGTGKH